MCYWDDDGSDNHCLDEASYYNQMTLRHARASFVRTGVCDGVSNRYTRPPTVVEIKLRRFDNDGEELPRPRETA